jgi:protein-disulfide isomerase
VSAGDSPLSRRALLLTTGTLAASAGVVYGASRLDAGGTATSLSPSIHRSSETTGFDVDLTGHPVLGDLDAPVDVYYWSDYQCPFCHRFEQRTLPDLVETEVREGRVRVVFLEFPYIGSASWTAAVVDRCVWRDVRGDRPDAYWPWHAAVFDAREEANSGWATRSTLLDIADDVGGVDPDAVGECVAANRAAIEARIETDVARARELGVRGTPAFVLYDRSTGAAGTLVGAQPYDRFETAIDRLTAA